MVKILKAKIKKVFFTKCVKESGYKSGIAFINGKAWYKNHYIKPEN